MKLSFARQKLIDMYIKSLKEEIIPWRKCWVNGYQVNGISNKKYQGVNRLLLSLVSEMENYNDSRWFTYLQIKQKGYKLRNAKNKGVPLEFWSVYDLKNKKKINFLEYEKIIESNPKEKENYRVFCSTTFVFNATYIEGVPEIKRNKEMKNVQTPKLINNIIKNLGVKYSEHGHKAYYDYITDEVVLPSKEDFLDKYSYFATQLHELCHATGYEKRLDRNLSNNNDEEYAREELIVEISASLIMQELNVGFTAEHFNNHKAYIQHWIKMFENNPHELFKAINEANIVCDYIEKNSKDKNKEKER